MLVLQAGLDPEYVLDRMERYEIKAICENLHLRNRDQLEMARLQTFYYLKSKVKSTVPLKPADIVRFPWEQEKAPEAEAPTQKDIERLHSTADMIRKQINNT